jgi:hypothetical protein
LRADSTTYIFVSGTERDSLTIFYNRVFRYKGDCGFIADASRPNGTQVKSTFQEVTAYYSSYVIDGKVGLFPDRQATGILINVTP